MVVYESHVHTRCVAVQERERAPTGLLERIVLFRAFAAALHAYDEAENVTDLPRHPMIDRVREIDFAHAADVMRRREETSG